jgi:hypothetical protein
MKAVIGLWHSNTMKRGGQQRYGSTGLIHRLPVLWGQNRLPAFVWAGGRRRSNNRHTHAHAPTTTNPNPTPIHRSDSRGQESRGGCLMPGMSAASDSSSRGGGGGAGGGAGGNGGGRKRQSYGLGAPIGATKQQRAGTSLLEGLMHSQAHVLFGDEQVEVEDDEPLAAPGAARARRPRAVAAPASGLNNFLEDTVAPPRHQTPSGYGNPLAGRRTCCVV